MGRVAAPGYNNGVAVAPGKAEGRIRQSKRWPLRGKDRLWLERPLMGGGHGGT